MDPQDIKNLNVRNIKPTGSQFRSILAFLGAIVVVLIIWNLWFTVEPEEVGLVLRFGKYVREAPPGLNFKLPAPIETVIKVPVQRQLKEEFGFRTAAAGVRTQYSPKNYDNESLMLTGDLNVAVVEWTAQYRIKDPYKFLFKVKDPRNTFRDMNEAVMREVVGNRTVNDILTIGRQSVADEVKRELQRLCNQYEMGIAVEQIVLQDVNPPDPVKPSFNEVNQAQQEKEKMINNALAEYNRIIPKAKGQALQTIQEAEGYAADRVNRAQGDAIFFEKVLRAYKKAPEVTRQRLYLETMDIIFPKIQQKTVIDERLKNVIPLMPLGKKVLP